MKKLFYLILKNSCCLDEDNICDMRDNYLKLFAHFQVKALVKKNPVIQENWLHSVNHDNGLLIFLNITACLVRFLTKIVPFCLYFISMYI